jgi:tRNA(adenine34) deaminase
MEQPKNDEHFMRLALAEAQHAFEQDEVPVGAVIVARNQVIARAHNLCERLNDFTAHAEMQAFTAASEFLGGKHLELLSGQGLDVSFLAHPMKKEGFRNGVCIQKTD